MVACLLYSAPDVLPRRHFSSSFGAQDAIVLLQKCTNFKQMKQIHAKIIRNGLDKEQLIVTKLLRLCSVYRKIDYATLVFHQIQKQNPQTFTWNLLIRAYNY
ncbi:Pentatricopeptide repeat-containing protein [Forsythia ovata]|uniref:Pentatricopeptide repeat-containing protein n=1 Tax=Forsythia ovata TaxID=205694 RepID=A0ABD1T3L9_9LAMI